MDYTIEQLDKDSKEIEALCVMVLDAYEQLELPTRIANLLGRTKEVLSPLGALVNSLGVWYEALQMRTYAARYKALQEAGLPQGQGREVLDVPDVALDGSCADPGGLRRPLDRLLLHAGRATARISRHGVAKFRVLGSEPFLPRLLALSLTFDLVGEEPEGQALGGPHR